MNNKDKKEEIQNTEDKNQNPKKKKSLEEDQFRVVISREVNEILEKLVIRANDGFYGGDITKSDVANLLLLNSTKSFSDVDIKILRTLHFDEKKMLRAILRQSGDEGDLPEHLKKALREHYGFDSKERKTLKKAAQTESKESLPLVEKCFNNCTFDGGDSVTIFFMDANIPLRINLPQNFKALLPCALCLWHCYPSLPWNLVREIIERQSG